MEDVIERQKKRFQFLKLLYGKTNEGLAQDPQVGPLFSTPELGQELGFTIMETYQIVYYLMNEGLLDPHSSETFVAISQNGIRKVEDALIRLEEPAEHFLARMEHVPIPIPAPSAVAGRTEAVKVFISHSGKDAKLAELLADLLASALNLRSGDIRCTSVAGYRLHGGANTNEQLRDEALHAPGFIGLVSEASFNSVWVLFECGARWGAQKHWIPLLAPGVDYSILEGPVVQLHALSCDNLSDLCQLVEDMARILGMDANEPSVYTETIQQIMAWKREGGPEGGMVILRAIWGAGDETKNVTDLLQSKIVDGKLEIKATEQALGCDPAPMVEKILQVTYLFAGEENSKVVRENAMLSLP